MTSSGRRFVGRAAALLAGLLGVAVIVTAGVWAWDSFARRDRPLEADWPSVVTVVAGDGVAASRDGGPGQVRFAEPFGVAIAGKDLVYVADAGDSHLIRRVSPDGSAVTVAGGTQGYGDGVGREALFSTPSGLATDKTGNVYIADTGNNAIRRMTPDGTVSTLAGDRFAGFRDGPAAEARFNGPIGVAVDRSGVVVVADSYNDRIRAIRPDGTVVTIAGAGRPGYADGPHDQALFHTPCGVAIGNDGSIYVADTGNGLVRMVSRQGLVTTLWPQPDALLRPAGIAVDEDGSIYVGDDRGRIHELRPGRDVRTLAGTLSGFANGPGLEARFRALAGIALAGRGTLVVADPRNALVRRVAPVQRRELHVPASPFINPGFDRQSFRLRPLLWPIAPMEGPFEITGTMGELRGSEGTERFHSGIDIHAADNTPVLAVRPGIVASPLAAADFNTLNESVRIGSLAYVHLRVGRDRDGNILDTGRFVPTYDEAGRVALIRVKRGARFRTGEAIGTVNAFNHVHLNVGWPGEEMNPLAFRLVQHEDTVRPTIARGGIRLFGEQREPVTTRRKGRVVVDRNVSIVVDVWDQMNGNRPSRRLGLYELGYQILRRDGTPVPGFEAPKITMRFDGAGLTPDAARLVFATGSGIPFYGRRRTRFLYVVTNTFRDGVAELGWWNASELAPGDYTVRIHAADASGNAAVVNRELRVTVIPKTLTENRQ